MNSVEDQIIESLFALQDLTYKAFHCKLMPTVNPDTVIGVRTSALRKFAKQFAKTPESTEFLHTLPHQYYDENNLHGFLISNLKDYGQVIEELNRFLPYVDNWATCDLISPKSAFQKNPPGLLEQVRTWMASDHVYTVRYGVGVLLEFYLDDLFQPEHLDWVCEIKSEEYYINMMIAWYFSTVLVKQYHAALPYLEQHRLEPWVHNKTIQKAIESYRIKEEQKEYLRSLKLKAERK